MEEGIGFTHQLYTYFTHMYSFFYLQHQLHWNKLHLLQAVERYYIHRHGQFVVTGFPVLVTKPQDPLTDNNT